MFQASTAPRADRPTTVDHGHPSESREEGDKPLFEHGSLRTSAVDQEAALPSGVPPTNAAIEPERPAKRLRMTPPSCGEAAEGTKSRPSTPDPDERPSRPSSASSSPSPSSSPGVAARPFVPQPASPPQFRTPRFTFANGASRAPVSPPTSAARFVLDRDRNTPGPEAVSGRPNFILPPADDSRGLSKATDPAANGVLAALLLSPRKKGPKFVAGGLAATVRDWAFEIANALPTARGGIQSQHGRSSEPAASRIKLEGSTPGPREAWRLVRGRSHGGSHSATSEGYLDVSPEHWILIGEQRSSNMEIKRPRDKLQHDLHAGDSVAVHPPVWDVRIAGKSWHVGPLWDKL